MTTQTWHPPTCRRVVHCRLRPPVGRKAACDTRSKGCCIQASKSWGSHVCGFLSSLIQFAIAKHLFVPQPISAQSAASCSVLFQLHHIWLTDDDMEKDWPKPVLGEEMSEHEMGSSLSCCPGPLFKPEAKTSSVCFQFCSGWNQTCKWTNSLRLRKRSL